VKVSELKEGMLLEVGLPDTCPVVRLETPDRLVFFPDILALAGFARIRSLDPKSYYFYLGVRRVIVKSEYTALGLHRTKTHHEVMDPSGYVYKVHGREFKNFEPLWKEDESVAGLIASVHRGRRGLMPGVLQGS
jgi:hypothetical protein